MSQHPDRGADAEPRPEGGPGQLALGVPAEAKAAARRRPAPAPPGLADVDPVAEVLVDVPLAHLDRVFEYAVPAPLAQSAQPGVRVKVRFAGGDRDGFVVSRKAEAEHPGKLAPLRRVVSPEPVLTPPLIRLCRAVADRWAGTLGDVLRLAVPPRHAQAEQAAPTADDASPRPPSPAPGAWEGYPGGAAFLGRIATGEAPRAAWLATPSAADASHDWPAAVATAVLTALSAGRGALVVVPDARDVARVDAALTALDPDAGQVVLTADLGPRARYTAWLSVLRGAGRAVIGTRAAMFAPVRDLGLVVCWDDGDDLHAEPHAPYPHVREVLALRSELEGAAALFGGFVRTAEVERMVQTGWARPVQAPPATLRAGAPRVLVAGEGHEPERDAAADTARLPSLAWRTAAKALDDGPVLVQVPRRGYVPALACQQCRTPARCPACHGPLMLAGGSGVPTCRWCATASVGWRCPECGDRRLRSVVVGARRTAEELGRAFPGTPVVTSGGGQVVARVPARRALVIATPGAEPVADGGYAAALLLDPWALLGRSDLRAGEEALRRWADAAALVRSSTLGGVVVLAGPGGLPPVEALVRWAPTWHSGRELSARQALGFPPARAVATLTGPAAAVDELVAGAHLPGDVEVLGPVPVPPQRSAAPDDEPPVRLVLRTAPAARDRLADGLKGAAAGRSARKRPGSVRVQVDPLDLV
ncbi:primosomal protein N' [Angustibacter sp. Root456]|uniref:primosomal protein N' n=1 Tax=Angustibacter sp. Root456 TaxID=1736539 RepID=UPI000B08AA2D|nr:primosomal protein N' [Angustibacter sp. Root456]